MDTSIRRYLFCCPVYSPLPRQESDLLPPSDVSVQSPLGERRPGKHGAEKRNISDKLASRPDDLLSIVGSCRLHGGGESLKGLVLE